MRDFGLLFSLLSLAGLALWRPWLGVLGLAFFGYMQPHSYAHDFMREFPVYRTLFVATVAGTLFTKDRQLPPRDWRVFGLLALWLYFFLTTELSFLHHLAWPKFLQVSMVLASTFLILILINNREKLFSLLAVTALSFALVTVKGGYWTIINGFTDRVYGPPGSQYGDNNHFAVAAVMAIPLLLLWFRQSSGRWLKAILVLVITLTVFAALSSWSRGAVLALSATALLLAIGSRRRALDLLLVASAVMLAVAFFLPEHWFARIETIAAYETDGSAQGRLYAWSRGIGYALHYPLAGAGFDGWRMVTRSRDFHSAFVEIMAEHGLLVFLLWVSLILGTLLSLTRLAWQHRLSTGSGWMVDYAVALRASLVGYCVGGAFIGIGYWDLLYHLIAAAIILSRIAATGDWDSGPVDVREIELALCPADDRSKKPTDVRSEASASTASTTSTTGSLQSRDVRYE